MQKDNKWECHLPRHAVWNGSMFGDAPKCLTDLNVAELALVSANHITTNAVALESNCKKGIYGFHLMYQNDVSRNMSNIQCLIDSELKGKVCVCVVWSLAS